MFRLSGILRFDQKKEIYLALFEVFPFENWQLLRFWGILGILLSINPAKEVHTKKCFDYNFSIL